MNGNQECSKPVFQCAIALLAAFFMPWFQLFGLGLSGYDLGQLDSYGNLAWIIPCLAALVIFLSMQELPNRAAGALLGLIPLSGMSYALLIIAGEGGNRATRNVFEVLPHVLSIGGWLTIAFSVAIILAAMHRTEEATGSVPAPGGKHDS